MSETAPHPFVPAEVDLRDFAFMPLDVARLRDSDLAANETPECCWAAVLLWSASWHQVPAGSMPDDDRWIAKQAGYAQRGKVAREWTDVRSGALRGWVKCSDGRLYHRVVAEKALEAWQGKLKQRYATEAARIKKHNQRHGTSIACPSFGDWTRQGCPSGQELFVPRDIAENSGDKSGTGIECPDEVPRETPSKGQRQGQRQGQSPPTSSPPGQSGPETDPPTAAADADLIRRIRIAMGSEPVIATADIPTGILRMMADGRADGSIVEDDVFAGILAMFEKSEIGFRCRRYSQAEGWIRGAAKDRLAGKPRALPSGSNTAAAVPSSMIRGVAVPDARIQARVDRFYDVGEWPDDVRDRWGPAPGDGGCCIPPKFLKPKVAA